MKTWQHGTLSWLFYIGLALATIIGLGLYSQYIAPGPGSIGLLPFALLSPIFLPLGGISGLILGFHVPTQLSKWVYIVLGGVLLLSGVYMVWTFTQALL